MVSEKQLRRWAGDRLYPEEIQALSRISKRKKPGIGLVGFATIIEKRHETDSKGRVLAAGKNLVVNLGREAVRELMALTAEANGAEGSKDLGYLAVGMGTTAFVATSTALNSESTGPTVMSSPSGVVRPLFTVTALPPGPPYTTSLYSAQIGAAELNVAPYNVIQEMGAYCLDNTTLFAARLTGAQTKSAGFAIEGRWLFAL